MRKRKCPICGNDEYNESKLRKPYFQCKKCDTVYQPFLEDKVYQVDVNKGGHTVNDQMADSEKQINRNLANTIFNWYNPKNVLDIGCAWPYFLSCFKDNGCEVLGIEGYFKDPGETLGIDVLHKDWETDKINLDKKYDLITMIHVIEHFEDPIKILKKVKDNLTENGKVFLRMPDYSVNGIEYHADEQAQKVHLSFYSFKQMQIISKKIGMHLEWFSPSHGGGQSDLVLSMKKPTIGLAMIVKNEEQVLSRCLDSVKDVVDEMIIVDTGSTDKTKEIAKSYGATIKHFEWCDHFAKARNVSLENIKSDWTIWMDADDILLDPEKLRILINNPLADGYHFTICYGAEQFSHVRVFRTNRKVRFDGAVHEYPKVDGMRIIMSDVRVKHAPLEKHEPSTVRNLRILENEYKEDPNNSRTLFYYANVLKENADWNKSLEIYDKYLAISKFHIEKYQAQYYKAWIYKVQRNFSEAIRQGLECIKLDDRFAEGYEVIGESYYQLKDYDKCIYWMKMAAAVKPDCSGPIFKSVDCRGYWPWLFMGYAYENKGNYEKAIESYKEANKFHSFSHKDLIETCNTLMKKKTIIELGRWGAMGDVLMTTAAVKKIREQYPNAYLKYITHSSNFGILEGNKYLDEITDKSGPHVKNFGFAYPMHEGYPDKPLNRHLIDIFAECVNVKLDDQKLYLEFNNKEENEVKDFLDKNGKYITIHTTTGWSPYKNWYKERWEELCKLIKNEYRFKIVQIGGPKDEKIENADFYFLGNKKVKTCICYQKYASVHIGLDSIFNHSLATMETNGIILFGSTSLVGSGYDKNINIWKEDECSPCYREYNDIAVHKKPECPYNKKCMNKISVKEVYDKFKEIVK